MLVNAQATGGIGLWVNINYQHMPSHGRQECSHTDHSGGFADAAFLVGYRKNPAHSPALSVMY